jgi:hypothetical protein
LNPRVGSSILSLGTTLPRCPYDFNGLATAIVPLLGFL